jgi:ABC-2 type transport system permease protein
MTVNIREHLRIIWAIASKDIVDAIKNRTTLSVIISVLFLMVFYQILPKFENGNPPPRLVLVNEGGSSLISQLDSDQSFDLVEATNQSWMEAYIAHRDFVVLGLVLPGSFDGMVDESRPIALEGYSIHWAPDGEADELRTFFEGKLGELVGKEVEINLTGNTVFTRPDSRGMPFLISVMMVLALTIIGITLVPNLMLEEKSSKTIDTLMLSPASSWQLVAGKAVTGVFYCMLALAIAFAFNIALITHWWLAILGGLCGAIFVVSLGLLLGSVIEVRQQLMLWSWVALVPLIMPVFLSLLTDILPGGVITALGWIPTVALAKVFRVSFTEHAFVSDFGPELGLVIVASALILAVVVFVIRRMDRG